MASLTRKQFADRLGVDPGTVTKWGNKGLLALSADGLIDVEKTEWNLDQRPAKYRGGTAHRPIRKMPKDEPAPGERAVPAPKLAADPPEEPDALHIIADLVARSGAIAAHAAIEAGSTLQVAYALDRAVTVHLWQAAEEHLGIPPGSVSPFEAMVDERIIEPDWPALADHAGEHLDLGALDAFADALPSLQPPAA